MLLSGLMLLSDVAEWFVVVKASLKCIIFQREIECNRRKFS